MNEARRDQREEPVRVGLWGAGPHASRRVLPAIHACPTTKLVAISTRNHEVGRSAADRFGCVFHDAPEDMLTRGDIDAIYVATPTGLHAEQGRAVIAAGKHLWCEKSLTATPRESAALIASAQTEGVAICEAFMFAYHPQFRRLQELVGREQRLGKLSSIVCRFTIPPLERPGFRYSRALGGGALLDVGCYPVALLLHLVGEQPELLLHFRGDSAAHEVDLGGHAIFAGQGGLLAHLEWAYDRAYLNDVAIAGERGSLRADRIFSKPDDYEATLELRDLTGAPRVERFAPQDPFVCMLDVFARAHYDEAVREQLRSDATRQAQLLERILLSE